MLRVAHGCALIIVLLCLVAASSASANTITTVAGGGNLTPVDYTHFGYTNPLAQMLPAPTSVAWSGAPGGLFYVTAGNGKCVQLWNEPDSTDANNYGMSIEAGTWENCGVQVGGYPTAVEARFARLANPCCVTSNVTWDPNDAKTGPIVASTDTGHANFYSWKNNTGVTLAGSTQPADCNNLGLIPVSMTGTPGNVTVANPPTEPSDAQFCNVTAIAQQMKSPNFAVAEKNRGTYTGLLYLINLVAQPPEVNPISIGTAHAREIAGLAWDRSGVRLVATDGFSSIYAFQPDFANPPGWVNYQFGGPVAGGQPGFSGDGGLASQATFARPTGVAIGFDNSVYVADTDNCRIRRIDNDNPGPNQTAKVNTIAGNGCSSAPLADGGEASDANLDHPQGVAMAPQGLLIADTGHNLVRLVDRTTIVFKPSVTADGGLGIVSDSTPSFDIRSLDVPAHLKCTVDNVDDDCAALGPLGDGKHTLKAWENGVVGSLPHPPDPTPATVSFWVDTTAPTGVALSSPAPGATGVPSDTDFSWARGSDAIAGIDHYELWIGGVKDSDVPLSACGGDTCVAKASKPLGDGDGNWQIRAVDRLGNTSATEVRSFNTSGVPVAAFSISPNPALAGRSVTFDASASSDASGIARYQWDLDGDGNFETDAGASPTTARTYDAPTSITVRLRVTDGTGVQSGAEQTLRITQPAGQGGLLGISINSGAQYTKDPKVELLVKAPSSASSILVSNDGGFLAPTTFTVAPKLSWKLDSSGPERLPKTVYVRFMLGPIISETYTDDIILDEIPPVVKSAAVANTAAVRASASRRWSLKIRATDSNSGVSKVQVTANKRKPGKLLAYKTKLSVRSTAKPKFVRAQDRAGNFSGWKKLR